ncbi:MAG: SBBP repeat-containing protein [Candidatus Binataceae bacterium]
MEEDKTRLRRAVTAVAGVAALAAVLFAIGAAPRFRSDPAAAASRRWFARLPPIPRLRAGQGFERNDGQTDGRVKFLSRGSGYTLFLTAKAAVLALRKPAPSAIDSVGDFAGARRRDAPADHTQAAHPSAATGQAQPPLPQNAVLRIEPIGANPQAQIEGLDRLAGESNYFIGNDPKAWRTGIPNYARVRYRNVYPGIDLVYYYGTNRRQLEYDLILAPGANPRRIAMRFGGAERLTLKRNGGVSIGLADGVELVQRAPAIYQERDGRREKIAGRCVTRGKNTIGFELASYDHRRAVYIDPGLVFSTFLGGSGGDEGNGIALDSSGYVYVTGYTGSADFPTTAGAYQTSSGGVEDAFVTKFNPTGSALVYSTYLGGSFGGTSGAAIAVDSSGNAYLAGSTAAPEFPVTSGAFQTVLAGVGSAFVSKLNAAGSGLIYSTYLGGPSTLETGDYGNGIAVDSAGFAYITGTTGSPSFPTTAGAFQTTPAGVGYAVFVTKMNTDGTGLIYSTYLGGSGDDPSDGDAGNGIAVDSGGFAYVTGQTHSAGFPITAGAFQTTNHSSFPSGSAFVTKLNTDGSGLAYSTYLGGSGNDQADAVAVDSAGSAYVTGRAFSSDFPTTDGAFQTSLKGTGDAFITKLSSDGSALAYSTYLGGGFEDQGNGIAVDSAGFAYVMGYTYSTGFPTTEGAFQTTNRAGALDGANAFVTKLAADGSELAYSTYLGGSTYDYGSGIAIDSGGDAYVTGFARSADFPVTAGAFQTVNHGSGAYANVFVAELDLIPGATPTTTPIPSATATPTSSATTSITVPKKLNLGNSPVGMLRTKDLKVKNKGKEPLTIFSAQVAGGANPGDFSVGAGASTCLAGPIAPKGKCVIAIGFTPAMSGKRNGILTLTDNAGTGQQTVMLVGKGK